MTGRARNVIRAFSASGETRMRAETEKHVDDIRAAVALIRRHL
jgi:hypothetical protein